MIAMRMVLLDPLAKDLPKVVWDTKPRKANDQEVIEDGGVGQGGESPAFPSPLFSSFRLDT
jgi:hypothetical protein